MNRQISVSLPKTCSMEWAKFEQQEGGRLCQSCNKVVVDFTRMNDQEIMKYLTSQAGHICGRLNPNQLKTYSLNEMCVVRPGLNLMKAGVLGALMLLVAKPVAATPPKDPLPIVTVTYQGDEETPAPDKVDLVLVKGVVLADDGFPLPGVNVYLMGGNIGTVTDNEGKFEFPEKLKPGEVILFSFIGFVTKEYKVPQSAMEVSIKMEMDAEMMGALVVEQVYSSKEPALASLWRKVKNIF